MSSSSSSSSSSDGGGEGEGGDGGDEEIVGPGPHIGEGSVSRRRSADAVWPEHFVEGVASQVAVDATDTGGRLAAAPAIAAVFQVCSTWRAVSRSELLWEGLTRRIWSREHRLLPTWRDEYSRLHRTARNFRTRRSAHSRLLLPNSSTPALTCRRLALSDRHLAAGFLDGSVLLFDLPSSLHVATLVPHDRDRLGPFSQSVSGLLLPLPDRLVFASQDGDVHVAPIHDPPSAFARRAHVGNLVEDGTLVDFTGDSRRWIGLFAGVPGRSVRVWDGVTEQLVYVGGSLTDPDSVLGWHLLAELTGPGLGRVRISDPDTVVLCTGSRIQVVDLADPEQVLVDHELRRGAIVDTVDAREERVMVVDRRGIAKVRLARTLEEVCRFNTMRRGGPQQQQQQQDVVVVGCMNWGYAVVFSAGAIRVWDAVTGEFLYSFRERIGEPTVAVTSDRHVAAFSSETGLHLWDFGAL